MPPPRPFAPPLRALLWPRRLTRPPALPCRSLCGHSMWEGPGLRVKVPSATSPPEHSQHPKLSARPWGVMGVGDWVWTSQIWGRLRAALDCSRSPGLTAVLWAEVLGVRDLLPQPAVKAVGQRAENVPDVHCGCGQRVRLSHSVHGVSSQQRFLSLFPRLRATGPTTSAGC